MSETPDAGTPPRRGWRLLAQFGFWFFLLKGLAWLTVPALLAWWYASSA